MKKRIASALVCVMMGMALIGTAATMPGSEDALPAAVVAFLN